MFQENAPLVCGWVPSSFSTFYGRTAPLPYSVLPAFPPSYSSTSLPFHAAFLALSSFHSVSLSLSIHQLSFLIVATSMLFKTLSLAATGVLVACSSVVNAQVSVLEPPQNKLMLGVWLDTNPNRDTPKAFNQRFGHNAVLISHHAPRLLFPSCLTISLPA